MFFKRELCHFLRNIPFLIQWEALVYDNSVIDIVCNRHQSSHSFMFLSSPNRLSLPVNGRAKKYVPVFLGITSIDSFTNEQSWPKIVQKQTEINFYSSCPFTVEYFMFTLDVQSVFTLVCHLIYFYNCHAWCFSNVSSVSFWGIFRSLSNEIEKNLFNVGN